MIIIDILQSAYDIRRERLLAERGSVWVNPDTMTIHIEGGGMTVTELYKEVQKELRKETSIPLNVLGKQK